MVEGVNLAWGHAKVGLYLWGLLARVSENFEKLKRQLKCSSHLRYTPKTLACEIIIIAKIRSNNELVASAATNRSYMTLSHGKIISKTYIYSFLDHNIFHEMHIPPNNTEK